MAPTKKEAGVSKKGERLIRTDLSLVSDVTVHAAQLRARFFCLVLFAQTQSHPSRRKHHPDLSLRMLSVFPLTLAGQGPLDAPPPTRAPARLVWYMASGMLDPGTGRPTKGFVLMHRLAVSIFARPTSRRLRVL